MRRIKTSLKISKFLTICVLYYFASLVGFFYLDFCVKNEWYIKYIFINFSWF